MVLVWFFYSSGGDQALDASRRPRQDEETELKWILRRRKNSGDVEGTSGRGTEGYSHVPPVTTVNGKVSTTSVPRRNGSGDRVRTRTWGSMTLGVLLLFAPYVWSLGVRVPLLPRSGTSTPLADPVTSRSMCSIRGHLFRRSSSHPV